MLNPNVLRAGTLFTVLATIGCGAPTPDAGSPPDAGPFAVTSKVTVAFDATKASPPAGALPADVVTLLYAPFPASTRWLRDLFSPASFDTGGAVMPRDSVPKASADPFPLLREQVHVNGESFQVIQQGQGPAILFCHGFPDTAETWRSQTRAVAEAGYHAVALDMRGFGASYAPADVSLYSALHTVGDLVGVLDALDIRTAVLVGHDWGADVAARAMVMRPDRFRAIVSVSIPFQPRGEISTWDELRRQGFGDRYYAFGMMSPGAEADFEPAEKTIPSILYWLSGSPPPGTGWDPVDPARHMLRPSPVAVPSWADPTYVEHTIRAFEKTGFHGGLNYYRAAQETFDLMPAFKNALIWQPSLYIWGAADGLCQLFHPTPPTVEELRHVAPGLVDVVRLENVGHWIQHEARDRLNAELLKFLDAIGSPPENGAPK